MLSRSSLRINQHVLKRSQHYHCTTISQQHQFIHHNNKTKLTTTAITATTEATHPAIYSRPSLFSYGSTSGVLRNFHSAPLTNNANATTSKSKLDEIAEKIELPNDRRTPSQTQQKQQEVKNHKEPTPQKQQQQQPQDQNVGSGGGGDQKEAETPKKKKKDVDLTFLIVAVIFTLLYASKKAKQQMNLPSVLRSTDETVGDEDSQASGAAQATKAAPVEEEEEEAKIEFNSRPPVNIAIVGSGISGSGIAYYTTELLQNVLQQRVNVTIYDRNEIAGGRLKHTEIGGVLCEIGGSHIIRDNYYAMRLLNSLGLHLGPKKPQYFIVWDDDTQQPLFVEHPSDPSANRNEYLKRYQLGWAIFRTRHLMKEFFLKFCKVYELQQSEKFFVPREYTDNDETKRMTKEDLKDTVVWENVPQFVDATRLYPETHATFYEYFCSGTLPLLGIQERFLREIVEPIIRVNYAQNTTDITAFAGAVATAGVFSDFRPIKEGTSSIISAMLNKAKPTLKLQSTVNEIAQIGGSDRFKVKSTRRSTVNGEAVSQEEESEYDFVILATPLEHSKEAIQFKGVTLPETMNFKRPYRTLHSTFVVGNLNLDYFKVKDERKPIEQPKFYDQIAVDTKVVSEEEAGLSMAEYGVVTTRPTTKEQALFNSIGPVGRTTDTNMPIFKVFSTEALTPELIGNLFQNIKHVEHHVWGDGAYPMLKVYEDHSVLPPIKLTNHLYYASAFESVISTIETNLINSKNIAFMIGKNVIAQMEKEEIEAKRAEYKDEGYTE